jgi:hypothetical protein
MQIVREQTLKEKREIFDQNWGGDADLIVRTCYDESRHYRVLDAANDYTFLQISKEQWVNLDKIVWVGLAN